MPRFHYTAVDAQGQSLTGEVDGSSLLVVREALRQQGLSVVELLSANGSERPLSVAESAAIVQQINVATQNDLPLVGSLRAFSEEVFSSRLRGRLIRVCDALETGQALETVLANPDLRLPSTVGAILSSGLPHKAMNQLLSLSVRTAGTTADLRARAFLLLTYPLLMVVALVGFWAFLIAFVTPQFESIFTDFGTELPFLTIQIIQFSRLFRGWNFACLLVAVAVIALLCCGYALSLRAETRRRLWCSLPIVGSMYRLTSLSEFAQLLAVMLESQVPLPQALTWSAMGVNDADLRGRADAVAARLRLGEDPVTAAQHVPGVPAYLDQMLRFAAHGAEAGGPLRSMAQLMESRAKSLSQVVMPLLEPIVLMAALVSITIYVLAVFMPLIKLLNDLS